MYRMLIVEDEAIERIAFRKFVEEEFSEIEVLPDAESGLQGLESAHRYQPDLLILDINMPELNGLHTLKMLRAGGYSGQVIIHSAYNYFEYARDALHYGANAYMLKPETRENLAKTIRECLHNLDEKKEASTAEEYRLAHLSSMLDYITEDVVTNIISDDQKRNAALDKLRGLGISLPSGFFITVQIPKEDLLALPLDAESEDTLIEAVRKEAKEAVCFDIRAIFSRPVGNCFSVLLSAEEAQSVLWYKHTASTIAGQIRDNVLRRKGISVRIGIGKVYNQIERFHRSYVESMQALGSASRDNPTAFGTSPTLARYHQIWRKIESMGTDWNTEKTFYTFEQCLSELMILMREKSLEEQREQSKAFWDVVCAVCKKSIYGWDAATAYHQKLSLLTVEMMEFLSNISESRDIRRIMIQTMAANIKEIHAAELERPNILIQAAAVYIGEHYAEALSLELVAEKIGISQFYLSHMFRKCLGCSFVDYLTDVRVKKALQLIRENSYTTKELAAMTGFRDPAYFCNVVKKVTGKTTGELKRETYSKQNV